MSSAFLKSNPFGSFGSSDYRSDFLQSGSTHSRMRYSQLGRMKTSPSMDRLNGMERSTNLTRHSSFLDIRSVNDALSTSSSPILGIHRHPIHMLRDTTWKQSDPLSQLSHYASSPRTSRTSRSVHHVNGNTPSQSFITDRRIALIGSLNFNVTASPLNPRIPFKPWKSSNNRDLFRPRIRERPMLAQIGKSIKSKRKSKLPNCSSRDPTPKNSLTEKWESHGGINRYRLIKFREHNIGQTPSQRRSSITWDLNGAIQPKVDADFNDRCDLKEENNNQKDDNYNEIIKEQEKVQFLNIEPKEKETEKISNLEILTTTDSVKEENHQINMKILNIATQITDDIFRQAFANVLNSYQLLNECDKSHQEIKAKKETNDDELVQSIEVNVKCKTNDEDQIKKVTKVIKKKKIKKEAKNKESSKVSESVATDKNADNSIMPQQSTILNAIPETAAHRNLVSKPDLIPKPESCIEVQEKLAFQKKVNFKEDFVSIDKQESAAITEKEAPKEKTLDQTQSLPKEKSTENKLDVPNKKIPKKKSSPNDIKASSIVNNNNINQVKQISKEEAPLTQVVMVYKEKLDFPVEITVVNKEKPAPVKKLPAHEEVCIVPDICEKSPLNREKPNEKIKKVTKKVEETESQSKELKAIPEKGKKNQFEKLVKENKINVTENTDVKCNNVAELSEKVGSQDNNILCNELEPVKLRTSKEKPIGAKEKKAKVLNKKEVVGEQDSKQTEKIAFNKNEISVIEEACPVPDNQKVLKDNLTAPTKTGVNKEKSPRKTNLITPKENSVVPFTESTGFKDVTIGTQNSTVINGQKEKSDEKVVVDKEAAVPGQKAIIKKDKVKVARSKANEGDTKKIRFRKYTIEDFDFLSVLGRGSFGKVLLANLKGYDVYFAVKCLKKHSVIEDDDVESTMIERKVLAFGSVHPFICKLFCTFQTESYLCFVMEWCCGGDLMFHVQKEGKFSEERARFYACEIICAVKFLHSKGIIYRDLKLDNLMLDSKGHVRLVDFGMCQGKIYREDLLPSNFCGTPEYMAPEIIKGVKYNISVDFWSFGVLLYEMVVGTSPFHGTDEDELLWNVCYEEVNYPRFLSKEIKNLLILLLDKTAETRLGMPKCPAGDICDHSFFARVEWEKVEKCQVKPPFVPKLKSPADVQYFDEEFTKTNPVLTAVDKSVIDSMDQTLFQGFSYTNPKMTD